MTDHKPQLKKLYYLFIGPVFLFLAAISAFLAATGVKEFPLGPWKLQMYMSDLGGLSVFCALIGLAFTLANVVYAKLSKKHALSYFTVAVVFAVVLCGAGISFWPQALVRLSFFPSAENGLVGYRFYIRGFKPGPLPLTAVEGARLFADSNGQPSTCAISKNFTLGPLGWSRFLAQLETEIEVSSADLEKYCSPGLDLSSVTEDKVAQDLLMPFIFRNKVEFIPEEIWAAEGASPVETSSYLTPLARYLIFLRMPSLAQSLPAQEPSEDDSMVGNIHREYGSIDHAYAIFRCDTSYADFLIAKGVHLNLDTKGALNDLIAAMASSDKGSSSFIDSQSWNNRRDPVWTLEDAYPKLAVSKDINSLECQKLFEFYLGRF